VIEAAEVRDARLAPLLMLAALTGMRRGELCALRWTDVDLERGELDVSRSVVVVPGGLAVKTTKTDKFRIVALDTVGVALLTGHRAKVEEWARQAEATVITDAYVFSHAVDCSKPFRPDNVTGFFTRVRDSLGLHEVRLHDLRHFTATQLIGAGVDVRTVAGRLGRRSRSGSTPMPWRSGTERRPTSWAVCSARTARSRPNFRPTDDPDLTIAGRLGWKLWLAFQVRP
jgi:integrase